LRLAGEAQRLLRLTIRQFVSRKGAHDGARLRQVQSVRVMKVEIAEGAGDRSLTPWV
jgi:hypothetical protein